MKLLSDILYKAGITQVSGTTNMAISEICFDSREVKKGTLFIAIKGTQVDGHQFIDKAVDAGAIAIVCEHLPKQLQEGITYVEVSNSAAALGHIASNYYDNPSSKLQLVGITGTNGKTTVATILYELFKQLGHQVGLLSTVVNKIHLEEVSATHTTPDALQLNRLLSAMVAANCRYCFMEVSSHAIAQNRIAGLDFAGGVFTNISREHLDFHSTFDDYIIAKKIFFDGLGSDAFALTNKDDKQGMVMLQNTAAQKKTFSLRAMADFHCKVVENQFSGLLLTIGSNEVWTKLLGTFNAYNILIAYGTANLLGMDAMQVLTILSNLDPVEGRFDCMQGGGITGIVDYAHTPDAILNVLSTINEMRTGNEKVITVIGCGGDRDKGKRPEMARIACEKSDKVIITSDNPRSEEPEAIIKDMKAGVDAAHNAKVLVIIDRAEAIKTACALAEKEDIILVAGKGHEKYQEVNGKKLPFDDKELLIAACKMINSKQ